jgi:hypothetical protein
VKIWVCMEFSGNKVIYIASTGGCYKRKTVDDSGYERCSGSIFSLTDIKGENQA